MWSLDTKRSIQILKCCLLHEFNVYRLTDSFGYIHDGSGNYSVGVKCSWLIDARDNSSYKNSIRTNDRSPTIRLHLEEFATECGWDHLYVFDGDSVESPLLAVYRYYHL